MSATNLSDIEVLTIEEAATILRISRNAAYAAARQWRATSGRAGLPCIEIGRTLRVPRAALDRLLGDDAGHVHGPPITGTVSRDWSGARR